MIQTVVLLQVSSWSRWSVAMGKQFRSCWECWDLVGDLTHFFLSTIFPMINIESLMNIFLGLNPPTSSFLSSFFWIESLRKSLWNKMVHAHRLCEHRFHSMILNSSTTLPCTCSCYQPIPPVHSRYPHYYPLLDPAGALTAVFGLVCPFWFCFVWVLIAIYVVCHVNSYHWDIKLMNWSSQAKLNHRSARPTASYSRSLSLNPQMYHCSTCSCIWIFWTS